MPIYPVKLLLSGSFNALYNMELMLTFWRVMAQRVPTTLTMLRPSPHACDRVILEAGGQVASIPFVAMPGELARHHAGLSILRTDAPMASVAAMPTKIAELLATGRPVVVNAGLGDAEELFVDSGAGVILRDADMGSLQLAVDELMALLEDPETPERCRAVAEEQFNLDRGVEALIEMYRSINVAPIAGSARIDRPGPTAAQDRPAR